jgi:hypothetical protein
MNNHIEVIGKIQQGDLAVKVLFSTDFGSNFGAVFRARVEKRGS